MQIWSGRIKLGICYLLMVGFPRVCLLAILQTGVGLNRPLVPVAAALPSEHVSSAGDPVRLILGVAIMLAVAQLLGKLFHKIWQPTVVGEMAAGNLLGPSLLGAVTPSVYTAIFLPDNVGAITGVSQIGVFLFVFLVGLSVKMREVHDNDQAAIVIRPLSTIVLFAMASLLVVALYDPLSPDGVIFTCFALFADAAMSITAIPVLARILSEQNLLYTPLGVLTGACAAAARIGMVTLVGGAIENLQIEAITATQSES